VGSNLVVSTTFKAVDKLLAPVKRMTKGVSKFTKVGAKGFARMERHARSLNSQLNRATKGFKGVAAIAGGLTLATGVTAGAQAFVDFDKAVTSAGAKFTEVTSRNDQVFKDLRKTAQDVGATSQFTAGQAAEGLNFLAMAGFNAKQSMEALPGVVHLATAAEVDLATATDIASDSLGAFNMMTSDGVQLGKNLSRINDVMAKTTTTANTSMEAMFETIKEGAPVAVGAGASVETFAALTGKLANAGIKGSAAGTTLKNMFVSLQAQTPKAAKSLKTLGVETTDSEGNMRDMFDIIEDLNKATQGMGNAAKASKLKDIFGKIPLAGVNVLLNEGAGSLRDYRKQLEGATGSAEEMSSFMQGGLAGVIAGMKSAFESIAIVIGDTFAPEIDAAIKKLTEVARGAKDWVQNNKQLIKTLFGVAKFAFKLFLVFKSFMIIISIVTKLKAVFMAFKSVMIAVNIVMAANPIGAIIVGIVALITLITFVIKKWNEWGAAVSLFLGPIGMLISIIQSFRRNWDMIVDSFKNKGILGGLKAIGVTLIDALLMPVQQLLGLLAKIPGIGAKIQIGADKIGDLRARLGVNTTTDEKGRPLNAEATVEKVRTERSEKTTNNKLGIDINNNTGFNANVSNNPQAIPVRVSNTVGFNQ
jgi:TP901 family phage tail tape measure protein